MKETELQYWHEWLNRQLFEGKLNPCMVKNYGMNGVVEGVFMHDKVGDEFIALCFDLSYYTTIMADFHIIEVLLHEMVHQYCYENGIQDKNETTDHTREFMRAAQEHGMNYNGRVLTDAVKMEVVTQIEINRITESAMRSYINKGGPEVWERKNELMGIIV